MPKSGEIPMKYHYRPAFNARVYGPAEARADRYWENRLRGGGRCGKRKVSEVRDGLTDKQIAHNMGITPSTLYAWKDKYPEISESLKKGKEVVDIEVENALLKRAKGYAYLEQKTEIDPLGKKTITKTVKQVAPDVGAAVFWLKNRRPDRWRDRVDPTAPMNPERQDDGFLAALDQKAVEVWNQPAEAEGDADEDKE